MLGEVMSTVFLCELEVAQVPELRTETLDSLSESMPCEEEEETSTGQEAAVHL